MHKPMKISMFLKSFKIRHAKYVPALLGHDDHLVAQQWLDTRREGFQGRGLFLIFKI